MFHEYLNNEARPHIDSRFFSSKFHIFIPTMHIKSSGFYQAVVEWRLLLAEEDLTEELIAATGGTGRQPGTGIRRPLANSFLVIQFIERINEGSGFDAECLVSICLNVFAHDYYQLQIDDPFILEEVIDDAEKVIISEGQVPRLNAKIDSLLP